MGVVGRELRVGLVLNSSELRLSEPSLRPLLMELLSSQLMETKTACQLVVIYDNRFLTHGACRYTGYVPSFAAGMESAELMQKDNKMCVKDKKI